MQEALSTSVESQGDMINGAASMAVTTVPPNSSATGTATVVTRVATPFTTQANMTTTDQHPHSCCPDCGVSYAHIRGQKKHAVLVHAMRTTVGKR